MSIIDQLQKLFGGGSAQSLTLAAFNPPPVNNDPPKRSPELTTDQATAQLTNGRSPWQHSTLGEITPQSLARILHDAANGNLQEFLILAEKLEETDPHYRSVLSTRKIQVANIPLTVEAASDSKKDQEIADFVRGVFVQSVSVSLIADMLDALAKGFSVCEITWATGAKWVPSKIEWRDPNFFDVSHGDGRIFYLKDGAKFLPLIPGKYIVHTPNTGKSGLAVRSGLARVAAFALMIKTFDVTAWAGFVEAYGMPLRIGKYGAGASEKDKRTLLNAVRGIFREAAAIIPQSMSIEFQSVGGNGSGGSGGSAAYDALAKFVDGQISKLILGQTGTSDATSKIATANAHERVRADIEAMDALGIAETLQRDLVRPLILLNFGNVPMPRLSMRRPDAVDREQFSNMLTKLVPLGLEVDQGWVRDQLSIPDPADDADLLHPPASGAAAGGDNNTPAPPTPDTSKAGKSGMAARLAANNGGVVATIAALGGNGEAQNAAELNNGDIMPSTADAVIIAFEQKLAAGIAEWEKLGAAGVGDLLLAPYLAAINSSSNYDEAIEKLNAIEINANKIAKELSDATMAARLFGNFYPASEPNQNA
ncbi:MAG: DUF935 family protein [Alphaproteobacteria bacterium]|nr:DUF935 family protein [Alphaproteobacteria bacterium]